MTDVCPECGKSLVGKSRIKHAISHYGELQPAGQGKVTIKKPLSPFAKARINELIKPEGLELV